jgi:5-methylcytosine-specific restriction endonuclease McrA
MYVLAPYKYDIMDCLILNTDGSPVSMLPLSTVTWQEAIKYMVLDKAVVLEWHDDWVVRSARWETPVPAVIMVKEYMKKKTAIRYSKANVFLRDEFTCQYCGEDVNRRSATLDHLVPSSKGGKSTWENSVCACGPCNAMKGNKLGVKPKKLPYKPTYWDLIEKRKKMPFTFGHPSWAIYLS